MTPSTPAIHFCITRQGVDIVQERPALTELLSGLDVAEALEKIPLLLPVCGQAQSIAAQRATSAAVGSQESTGEHRQREQAVLIEQGRAAAWRLAIDWPDLVGEHRDLQGLRAVQQARQPAAIASALSNYLPGLDEVTSEARLLDWVESADCIAARVLQHARLLDQQTPLTDPAYDCLAGVELTDTAKRALAAEPFDALQPQTGAVEIGPLAMARDPLITQLNQQPGMGQLTRRLLAQLLDTRYIASALSADNTTDATDTSAWQLQEGQGLGCATTARGPVFHRVVLDKDGIAVADWRMLAPTDWHCSRRGPLARSTADGSPSAQWLRYLVAGFDPCAAWDVVVEDGVNA